MNRSEREVAIWLCEMAGESCCGREAWELALILGRELPGEGWEETIRGMPEAAILGRTFSGKLRFADEILRGVVAGRLEFEAFEGMSK